VKKILSFDCHEALLTLYSKLGYDMDLMHYKDIYSWREHYRPIPKNIRILPKDYKVNPDDYFCCLIFNRHTQFLRVKDLGLPIFLQFATSKCNEPDLSGLENVNIAFCGYNQKMEYGYENTNYPVIWYGIDANEFKGYKGNAGYILTTVNDYRIREKVTRFFMYELLTNGLPAINYGEQEDDWPCPKSKSYEHMKQIYREAAIYLDTTLHSPLSFSVLEAMATGMPVVTTRHDDMDLIINNNVNGIINNLAHYLRDEIENLLSSRRYRKRLGENARETIKQRFTIDKFCEKWHKYFKQVL